MGTMGPGKRGQTFGQSRWTFDCSLVVTPELLRRHRTRDDSQPEVDESSRTRTTLSRATRPAARSSSPTAGTAARRASSRRSGFRRSPLPAAPRPARSAASTASLHRRGLAQARMICGATTLPVSADLEKGFGDAPAATAKAIRLAAGVGLVGGSIEDATGRKEDADLRPRLRHRARRRRGRGRPRVAVSIHADRARRELSTRPARSRRHHQTTAGLRKRRCRCVVRARACPTSPRCARVCSSVAQAREFHGRHPRANHFRVAELAAAGVRRISLATSLYRAAMAGLADAAREIRESGTFGYLDARCPAATSPSSSRRSLAMKLVDCDPRRHSAAILGIFNEAIANSTALYDYELRTDGHGGLVRHQAHRALSRHRRRRTMPVSSLGFASYGKFRERPAYKYTVEHSIYMDTRFRGQGHGRVLLEAIVAAAGRQDYHVHGRRHRCFQRREHQAARAPGIHPLRHRKAGRIQVRPLAGPRVLSAHTRDAGHAGGRMNVAALRGGHL